MEATRAEAHHLAVVLNEAFAPGDHWSEGAVLEQMDGGATFMMGIFAEHPVAVLRMSPLEDGRMEFADLGVLPIYRREGLARELLAEAINWCAIRGKDSISLDASDKPELAGLFESLDFVGAEGRFTRRLAR
jgi:GNAT superfamily N-acetyltransferase